jgi:hypothetical protein
MEPSQGYLTRDRPGGAQGLKEAKSSCFESLGDDYRCGSEREDKNDAPALLRCNCSWWNGDKMVEQL